MIITLTQGVGRETISGMVGKRLSSRRPLWIAGIEICLCALVLAIRMVYVYAKVAMWPYILTTIAVALFPLALAGYGGHLATLALPKNSTKKRNALLLVWGLAICGVLIFAASQVVAFKVDIAREKTEETFRISVNERLTYIATEPDRQTQKESAYQLKQWINNPDRPLASLSKPRLDHPSVTPPPSQSVPKPLPSYEVGATLYPESFYAAVSQVWGVPLQNPVLFQGLMINKYQIKFRGAPPSKPIKISYLQGNPESLSLALLMERVYGNAGWETQLIPRTDIGHITGIYVFVGSIEVQPDGVGELRSFAKDNGIPFMLDEQRDVAYPGFDIWAGKGPVPARPQP